MISRVHGPENQSPRRTAQNEIEYLVGETLKDASNSASMHILRSDG